MVQKCGYLKLRITKALLFLYNLVQPYIKKLSIIFIFFSLLYIYTYAQCTVSLITYTYLIFHTWQKYNLRNYWIYVNIYVHPKYTCTHSSLNKPLSWEHKCTCMWIKYLPLLSQRIHVFAFISFQHITLIIVSIF